MKKRKVLAGLLLAGICLCSCGVKDKETVVKEKNSDDLIVIGFSEVGAESDWRVAHTESLKNTFTEEKGYEFMFDDARQKQENQIASIRNYILQEVDYIVVAPIVETGWEEVLMEAKEAEIPLIVVDRMMEVDEELYTAWVGSDTKKEGDKAMKWLEEELKKQERDAEEISIVHVMGTLGSSAQRGRTEGLEEGVALHTNWEITARIEGGFTQAQTYDAMIELLETQPDIDVIYCENDNSAFGAIQALEEKGFSYGVGGDIIIIAFDATNAGLTACLKGEINLDVECNPLHGPRVEKLIEQLEAGETPLKRQCVSESYFTQENLSEEFIQNRAY